MQLSLVDGVDSMEKIQGIDQGQATDMLSLKRNNTSSDQYYLYII
jgi:hypothetical protein